MSKILYLVSKHSVKVTREIESLNKQSSTNTYDILMYSDLMVTIKNGVIDIVSCLDHASIRGYDMVFHRSMHAGHMRSAVTLLMASLGKKVVNRENHNIQCTSKLEQYTQFALHGLSIPDTLIVRGDKLSANMIRKHFNAPIVVKAIEGSNGRDNFLVSDLDDLPRLDNTMYYAVQPFIENKYDYRIIVADDEIIASYRRVRDEKSGSHLNNVSQGGRRELTANLPAAAGKLAIDGAKLLGRDLAGADVLEGGDGRCYLLEVNFSYGVPQLEEGAFTQYIVGLDRFFQGHL